jgi:hypothetical protein
MPNNRTQIYEDGQLKLVGVEEAPVEEAPAEEESHEEVSAE